VVHGGATFADPVLVDDALLAKVEELVPLAPLHNPANLEGMKVARRLFPDLPQVAVFDTAFHQTLPECAYTYAVPLSWREEHRIRRYGFHGTSHAFVSRAAARLLDREPAEVDLVVLHLGNGASATAVQAGRSVDTSMGLTPLEGLVMGTRSGDVDPALHAHLHRQLGWSLEDIDAALNRDSGLRGLAGENDFRELERQLDEGSAQARLAFDVYCYRVKKYVGAYYAALGSLDAVVFTAGVGEHSARLRAAALGGLDRLGISVEPGRNAAVGDLGRAARAGSVHGWVISPDGSPDTVHVVPTDEEWEIARQSLEVVRATR
jgi:acetate kinase